MALTGEITGSLLASISTSGGVNGEIAFDGSGTDNYNELDNKPSINGVVLEGNKTSADLHISSGGTDNYNDLLNKPKINGATLTGDVSDTQLQIDYNHLINKPDIPDISDIDTRLDTAETDIDNLQRDMSTAEDNIDDMLDDIATIKATDLTQNADISSLKSRVSSAETNISNLSTRVSSAESSISSHTTEISALDGRVTTAEGDIDTLQGDMTQAQSDISELNSSFANSLNNLKFKFVSKSINIPDGSTSSPKTVDVDLSSDLPTGASIVGVVSASIGAYRLPYTSNSGVSQTWIYRVTNSTTVVVENTTTGWGTSTIYLLVAYS